MLSFLATTTAWTKLERVHAARTLRGFQYAYPIFLLFFFLFVFTARSILAATSNDDEEQAPPKIQYGPGGKPLPIRTQSFRRVVPQDFSRPRKLVFEWLSVALCLTWMGNAAVVIVHALCNRNIDAWWCGPAPTVSFELQST
jgi:hypothetical protein